MKKIIFLLIMFLPFRVFADESVKNEIEIKWKNTIDALLPLSKNNSSHILTNGCTFSNGEYNKNCTTEDIESDAFYNIVKKWATEVEYPQSYIKFFQSPSRLDEYILSRVNDVKYRKLWYDKEVESNQIILNQQKQVDIENTKKRGEFSKAVPLDQYMQSLEYKTLIAKDRLKQLQEARKARLAELQAKRKTLIEARKAKLAEIKAKREARLTALKAKREANSK